MIDVAKNEERVQNSDVGAQCFLILPEERQAPGIYSFREFDPQECSLFPEQPVIVHKGDLCAGFPFTSLVEDDTDGSPSGLHDADPNRLAFTQGSFFDWAEAQAGESQFRSAVTQFKEQINRCS